ncbi:MAG: glycosyltransferase, partial [Candidatus Delongbacteria bacterium]|nr:glycosyltransferase [Candidatus Delongbacteria bacterium]
IDSLNELGFVNDVFFINAWEKGKIEYLKNIFKIRKIAKDYDLVHCHHIFSAMVYFLSFSKKPFILSLLGDINQRKRKLDKILLKFIKVFSKKVIHKNEIKTKKDLKMFYCPNGVNLNSFKPMNKISCKEKLGLSTDKKYALFVSAAGKGNSIKRYDKFEEVIKTLNKESIGIEPIILAGIERSMVPFYYNSSDIMILTSDHEGSPNAVKEAMACNIPVVSTDVGNVSIMMEGCNGSFVSTDNSVENIAKLVHNSLSSSEHNGRELLIKKELDMVSVAKRIYSLYKTILGLK